MRPPKIGLLSVFILWTFVVWAISSTTYFWNGFFFALFRKIPSALTTMCLRAKQRWHDGKNEARSGENRRVKKKKKKQRDGINHVSYNRRSCQHLLSTIRGSCLFFYRLCNLFVGATFKSAFFGLSLWIQPHKTLWTYFYPKRLKKLNPNMMRAEKQN